MALAASKQTTVTNWPTLVNPLLGRMSFSSPSRGQD